MPPLLNRAQRTRNSILDAAEELFAEAGDDRVTVREIALKAGVPLGLVSYHFTTKEKLFEEVVGRRAEALNTRRQQKLAALLRPTVKEIIDAFLRPYFDFNVSGGPGWRSYIRLISQTSHSGDRRTLMDRHFGEIARTFTEAIASAAAGLPRPLAARCYVYMVSVMVGVFAANDWLDTLSGGAPFRGDAEAAYESMVRFLAGGFRAIAESVDAATTPGAATAVPPPVPRKSRAKIS
jgi:AcrR family transcriptional regulator